jgi:flagellar protein FliT
MSAVVRAEPQDSALLGCYRSIERASRDMLSAARDSDWDRVNEIQRRCGTLIDQARRLGGGATLSRTDQQAKMRIVRQIVLNEAQIRRLANPWTERFERMVFGRPVTASDGRHAS